MNVPYEKPKPTPRNYRPETVTGSSARQVKNNEMHISISLDSILALLRKTYSNADSNKFMTEDETFA